MNHKTEKFYISALPGICIQLFDIVAWAKGGFQAIFILDKINRLSKVVISNASLLCFLCFNFETKFN